MSDLWAFQWRNSPVSPLSSKRFHTGYILLLLVLSLHNLPKLETFSFSCAQELHHHLLHVLFPLHAHTKIPSGEKPFNCTKCNYSCTTAGDLKKHLLLHSGGNPFSYTHCKYSCTQAGHLKTHLRTHSGEKPFTCDQCNYSSAEV